MAPTPPSFSCPTTDAERPRTNEKATVKKFRTLNIFVIAFLGRDTPALGERTRIHAVTQGPIALTLAAFFGEDYVSAVARAGNPIADVIPH